MKKIDLSIIIVSYNTCELLLKCLDSIYTTIHKYEFETIVVDNNSQDNSLTQVSHQFPQVKIISNSENFGFSHAVNQGINISIGEHILLLNSDIIAQPKAIDHLLDFVNKDPKIGLVAGQLLNLDFTPQASVFHLPTISNAIKEFWLGQKNTYQKYLPSGLMPQPVEAVVGAVMLIPSQIINKVGKLNEHYFMYYEDLDYCRRLAQKGYQVYYLPESKFVHAHGASGKTIPSKVNTYLIQSSKIYHGRIVNFIIQFILWSGQKLNHTGKTHE